MSARSRWLRSVPVLLLAAGAFLLPAGAAQADGSGSADTGTSGGGTPPGKAWVRAGHFVSGLGPVEVQLVPQKSDGSTSARALSQDLGYGTASPYTKVKPGTYTVNIRPEGTSTDSAAMLRRSLTLVAGKASTVALLGTSSAPRLATLSDDLTPPAAGTARVRVLSGAANAPNVTVMAVNGPTIASDVVLGQTTSYKAVPQGAWTLSLAGVDGAKVTKTIRLASGGVYTAVVLDGSTDKVRLSLVTDAQGMAATPKGPAATGLGGAADHGPSPLLVVGLVALTVAGAGAVGARRRSRGPAVAR